MGARRSSDLKGELEALKARARGLVRREAPEVSPRDPAIRPARAPARPSGPLEILAPGAPFETGAGSCYRLRSHVEALRAGAARVYGEYLDTLAGPPPAPEASPLEVLQRSGTERILYLDIETAGLSNAPLFLVGLMYGAADGLVIDQFFARDYTEERAVLAASAEVIGRYPVLVTFNGARFDVPFIAGRLAAAGLPAGTAPVHVDLLPLSRRVLAGRTPDHRLQTLERFVLGRRRIGDIAGSEIPGAYHEFVRSGDACDMAAVIDHNRLDLLSMLELVTVYLARA